MSNLLISADKVCAARVADPRQIKSIALRALYWHTSSQYFDTLLNQYPRFSFKIYAGKNYLIETPDHSNNLDLMRVLAGIYTPLSGKVVHHGKAVLVSESIFYYRQGQTLFELLWLRGLLAGCPIKTLKMRISRALEISQLSSIDAHRQRLVKVDARVVNAVNLIQASNGYDCIITNSHRATDFIVKHHRFLDDWVDYQSDSNSVVYVGSKGEVPDLVRIRPDGFEILQNEPDEGLNRLHAFGSKSPYYVEYVEVNDWPYILKDLCLWLDASKACRIKFSLKARTFMQVSKMRVSLRQGKAGALVGSYDFACSTKWNANFVERFEIFFDFSSVPMGIYSIFITLLNGSNPLGDEFSTKLVLLKIYASGFNEEINFIQAFSWLPASA